jgi:hypothetical protein
MKLLNIFLSIAIVAVITSCGSESERAARKEARKEAKEGWVRLFDGKTTEGWRGYNSTEFPSANWEIVDGTFHCLGVGKGDMTNTDIITEKKYGNFELSLEWKLSEGGNSGIFIMVQEIPGVEIYKSAPEMQVLDNINHPDAKLGINGNRQAGSLYDMIPAIPQNAKPIGEWNQVGIIVNQGNVIFRQNGVDVVTFTLGTEEWKQMCENSKFKDWSWFVNTAKEGYIGLQDHGFEVWFRNIRLKIL